MPAEPVRSLEDLLVSLADCCWKGRRDDALEELVTARLATHAGLERWKAFEMLDGILQDIAADAPARLAWQARAT